MQFEVARIYRKDRNRELDDSTNEQDFHRRADQKHARNAWLGGNQFVMFVTINKSTGNV